MQVEFNFSEADVTELIKDQVKLAWPDADIVEVKANVQEVWVGYGHEERQVTSFKGVSVKINIK